MKTHRFPPFTKALSGGSTRRTMVRGLGGGGLAAALIMGTKRGAVADEYDEEKEIAREAMEALSQALATGDDSGLHNVFATDVMVEPRHRLVATGEEVPPGLTGLKEALADIRRVATDIEIVVDDLIAEDHKVAGPFTVRGTLVGRDESLEARGLLYMGIDDDRVTELWIYPEPYLMMDMMALIGMATPMPSAQVVPVEGGGRYLNVSPEDLASMLAAKTFQLVNVHVPYEGEIVGTDLFIPFDQIEQNRDKLPADTGMQIVLYCRTGRMSAIAAEVLVKFGYGNVWNLDGGMVGWEQAGYSLLNKEQ